MKITLIKLDIMVLLQNIVVGSEIRCLEMIVLHLLYYQIGVVIGDKYLLIFYRKFLQLLWCNQSMSQFLRLILYFEAKINFISTSNWLLQSSIQIPQKIQNLIIVSLVLPLDIAQYFLVQFLKSILMNFQRYLPLNYSLTYPWNILIAIW